MPVIEAVDQDMTIYCTFITALKCVEILNNELA